MTEYTHYTITNQVVLEDPGKAFEVDGVEIITRKEREEFEQRLHDLMQAIDNEIERAILYGDAPAPVALPKPTT